MRWLATPTLKGLPDPAEHGLAALLALLRRRRPRTQFAPADWLREHRARRVTYWVAGASALACALLAGLALQQLANAQAAREQLLSLATIVSLDVVYEGSPGLARSGAVGEAKR